jgi:type IV pilus assembly protein PilB
MIDAASKQPLLLQLLNEQRKFVNAVLELYPDKLTPEQLAEHQNEELKRRAAGARASTLKKLLVKKGVLTDKEADAALKKARSSSEGFIAAKDMEAFRKAQQEAGATLEKVLVKLGLTTEMEIAGAFAEYLHLPLAKVVSSNFGDIALKMFAKEGVTQELLAELMAEQEKMRAAGKPQRLLGELLIDRGTLTQDQVKAILDEQQVLSKREGELVHDPEYAKLLPEKFCRENLLCASGKEGGNLVVAVVDPSNILLQEEIQHMAGLPVVLVVGPHSGVVGALNRVFGVRDVVREISVENYDSATAPQEDEAVLDLQEPIPPGVDGRIIRLANTILEGAIVQRASDIHLEPFEKECRVRYRVDGELLEITPPPKQMFVPLVSRFKILAKMDIAEKRIAQDGAFGSKLGDVRVDYRVNTVPTVYGEKMVMRLLRKEGTPKTLEQLGFLTKQAEDFATAIQQPHGLIFVTGPTGSGKSTTLYAALSKLNDPTINITTVEDPVEYKMTGINQVQVKSQVGLTFATALRAFLRQDPDVMMVGEVRDRETAEICLRAALTGHLVVSTLHTNDSLAAVPRLADMGIEPFLLSATLRMVEAQRLVRRLCAKCKQPQDIDEETAKRLGMTAGEKVFRPKGCEMCRGSGYSGRVGLYEVIPITPEIARLIQQRTPLPELRAAAQKQGMALLRDAGIMKAREGVTSLEEVLSITLAED